MASARPPLWEVIAAASVQALFDTSNADIPVANYRIAAMFRAIAEEIRARDSGGILSAYQIQNWLFEEADRAEAGR